VDELQEQLRESNMTIASLRLELQSLRAKGAREREERERERREREEEEARTAALHAERTARAAQLAAQVAALTFSPSRPNAEPATTATTTTTTTAPQSPSMKSDPVGGNDLLRDSSETFHFEASATTAATARSPKKTAASSPTAKGKRRSTSKIVAPSSSPTRGHEGLVDPPSYFSSPVLAPKAPPPTPLGTPVAASKKVTTASPSTSRGGVVVLPSPKGVMLSARKPEGYQAHPSPVATIVPPSGPSLTAASSSSSSSPHAKTVRISTASTTHQPMPDPSPMASRGLETLRAELPRVFDELVIIKRMLEEQLQQQNRTY
jgi:hypothetical protein